jgi:hypothetical protein
MALINRPGALIKDYQTHAMDCYQAVHGESRDVRTISSQGKVGED